MSGDPWSQTAEEVARQVRAGEAAAVEILEGCLARLDEVEPRIGAFLRVRREAARATAAGIDRRRSQGEPLGLLAGVPVALKDNLSLAGEPLTCGSRILEGYVAPFSATAVERLLAEDAVIVGQANMDEFAMGSSCENSAFQITRNPWHLGSVPGGSSGGSAAAVAAATVPLALGSDTGGSIRQPAALCGVVGLKPSYGRVSRYGLVAFGSSLDQIGPLARRVRDAALALRAIAGPDRRDSTAAPRESEDYLDGIERGIAGVRVGTIAELDTEALAPDVSRNFEQALAVLSAAGAALEVVSIPNLAAAVAAYYMLANSEASANLARFDGIRYGRRAEDVHSLAQVYTESRSRGFGPEVKRRIMLGTFALSSGYYEHYYGLGRGVAAALRTQFERALAQVDVLVTPTTPAAAFGIGEKIDDPLAMYLSDVFTTPANLVGAPAVAVPSGLDARGLPLSLQIMARPFEEGLALRVARALEQSLGLDHRPRFLEGGERAAGAEVARG